MYTSPLPGLTVEALGEWLSQHGESVTGNLRFEVVEGGRSNLTYLVTDEDGRQWVLRRPPKGLTDAPQDPHREYDLLASLQETEVPTPRVVGADVAGDTPFYFMEFVKGRIIRSAAEASALSPSARRMLGPSMVDLLAKVHDVDVSYGPLRHIGSSEPYVRRQLSLWLRQSRKLPSSIRSKISAIHRRLLPDAPRSNERTLTHGDFKLSNVLVDDEGGVTALLDWELATVGDPLADLALFLAYWPDPADESEPPFPSESAPTDVEGFASHTELIGQYRELTRRECGRLPYYMAFAYWRLSVIVAGVHERWMEGTYGSQEASDIADYPTYAGRLLDRAERTLEELQ